MRLGCHRELGSLALMVVFGAYATLYVLIPISGLLGASVLTPAPDGFVGFPLSLRAWQSIVVPAHLSAFVESFFLAFIVTGAGLSFAVSVGYMYFNWSSLRPLLLSLMGAALLTNPLVLTMGWLSVLSAGTVPHELIVRPFGLDGIQTLLYTDYAMVLGLLSVYVPITTFPLLLAIHNLDPALPLSAALLGAGKDRIYMAIVLPVARAEIVFGALATLVSAVTDIVAPDILGGNRRLLLGRLISLSALEGRDVPVAAVLVIILLVLLSAILILALRRVSTPDER